MSKSSLDYLVFLQNEDAYFYSAEHTEASAKRFPYGFAVPYQPDFHTALLLLPPNKKKPRHNFHLNTVFNRFRQDCKDIRYISMQEFCRIWLVVYKPTEAMTAKLQGKDPIAAVLGLPPHLQTWWVAYSIST